MADPPSLDQSLLPGDSSNQSLLSGDSNTASGAVINTGATDNRINPNEGILDRLKTNLGIGGYLHARIFFVTPPGNSGGSPQGYASVEQKNNLENAQGERTKIYKDYIEYNASYLTSMTFFVGCITTFGGLLTFVLYFGGMKSEKYFIINLVCLLGTFLFGFVGAALITYSHIRKLKWAKLSLHRRISNLRNKVNFAPSTDALLLDEYEVQISELKASLGDERDFGMVAFVFFCVAGFCMIICWGIYDIPGHLEEASGAWE